MVDFTSKELVVKFANKNNSKFIQIVQDYDKSEEGKRTSSLKKKSRVKTTPSDYKSNGTGVEKKVNFMDKSTPGNSESTPNIQSKEGNSSKNYDYEIKTISNLSSRDPMDSSTGFFPHKLNEQVFEFNPYMHPVQPEGGFTYVSY